MKKGAWWVVGVIVIIIVVVALVHGSSTKTETGPIKIGFIGPLTGDGAAYGADTINAARLAEKEINDAGGINDRPIQIISEDGKCTAKDGLNAAQKLINVDGVKYIVSSSCSGSCRRDQGLLRRSGKALV